MGDGHRQSDLIAHDHAGDGIDRRGFLSCMAWAGTGLLWSLRGGIPSSHALSRLSTLDDATRAQLFFAQISDSHIGFNKAANQDVTATLQEAVARLNALRHRPAFVLHTGDITQLSRPDEFDTADQVLRDVKTERLFFVPGEHDVLGDNGASYLKRYGRRGTSAGWYSFDHSGVHFIGLVNVLNLKAGGLGSLGHEQIEWLRRDVDHLASSTPIVLFAHVPLWTVYPEWGWGTDDSAQALALLRRFGSVTVLNGHIHQIMQKVEGQVAFHTAMSTAFPQPAPGTAAAPGPLTVAPALLRSVLGITDVTYITGHHSLAVVDATLSGTPPAFSNITRQHESAGNPARRTETAGANQVLIDNFSFAPRDIQTMVGAEVTWINHDDLPHVIASANGSFPSSPVLDTGQRFSRLFTAPGTYPYFCSIHPTMTGSVLAR